MVETRLNQLSFLRCEYRSIEKRRLANRWRRAPTRTVDLIVPVVDGVPLNVMLGFNGIAGLAARFVEPHAIQWLGPPEYADDDGRAVIIDGTCGVAECCGVLAVISIDAERVTWSNFKFGPYDPERSEPMEFEFDRVQYESAVREAGTLQPTPVDDRY